jgi:hypothetical protein
LSRARALTRLGTVTVTGRPRAPDRALNLTSLRCKPGEPVGDGHRVAEPESGR